MNAQKPSIRLHARRCRPLLVASAQILLALVAMLSRGFGESVTQSWVQRYNGPANSNDDARAVALDSAGDVVVTGLSPNASNWDYYTAKYAGGDGALLWEKRYNGPANRYDRTLAIALDSAGNAVVTGYSENESNPDYYTAKYAATDGALLWEKRYNGPTNSYDVARAVALDSADDVVVTGYSDNGSNMDYYTAKYAAADGALLWEKRYDSLADGIDDAQAVALDSAGNVVVTGYSDNGSNTDYYTAKYAAADGTLLWEKRYNGPTKSRDEAAAVALDSAGNVVVTGFSQNGSNGDYYTAKYAATDGALLWEKRYNGPANSTDLGRAMALDSAGNVVVTGYSYNGSNYDYYTVKYAAADGGLLWEKRYDGPGDSRDEAQAVALDRAGNVVVTGFSTDGSNGDYYTAKYAAADGALLWEKRYNGLGNGFEVSRAVALDSADNVVVTGSSNGDYATVKYSPPFVPPAIHAFTDRPDGKSPEGRLLLASDGMLYGTTTMGGAYDVYGGAGPGDGTVYRLNPTTGIVTQLFSLSQAAGQGQWTRGDLLEGPDGMLYGTSIIGGVQGNGTIWKIRKDGGGYTKLHDFTTTDGVFAHGTTMHAGLTDGRDGWFYGTTAEGGANNRGTVFRILATSPHTFQHLTSFPAGGGVSQRSPLAWIEEQEGFVGVSHLGGANDQGFLFAYTHHEGTVFNMHDFSTATGSRPPSEPVYIRGRFYGVTEGGGANGGGVLYRLDRFGGEFNYAVLHSFTAGDGQSPRGLIKGPGDLLYGVTRSGGAYGKGTVFVSDLLGRVTVLHHFSGLDGEDPTRAIMFGPDGKLYGTTFTGGASGAGTVFRLDPGALPQVQTGDAEIIGGNDVRLHATVRANGLASTGGFHIGLSSDYGTVTTSQNLGNGTAPVEYFSTVSQLAPHTTYHYRAYAINALGSAYGEDRTFTTANSPVVADMQSISTLEDSTLSIQLTGSDPDGDALQYSLVSAPTHGTVTGTAPSLTYTPATDFNGQDSFVFRVEDGFGSVADATITIDVQPVNDAPVAGADAVATDEDSPATIAVLANDGDIDSASLTVSRVSKPANGAVTINADGTITYVPAANFFGTDSFTYTITDGVSDPNAAHFYEFVATDDGSQITWEAARDAAAARTRNGAQGYLATITSAEENSIVTSLLTGGHAWIGGSDAAQEGVWRWEVGPEAGKLLSYANWKGGEPNNYGGGGEHHLQILGDRPDRLGMWNDIPNEVPGSLAEFLTYGYIVEYGGSAEATATVTVTVRPVNDAPVADTQSFVTNEDTRFNFTLTGSDTEGDPLTYTIVSGPDPKRGTLRVNGPVPNFTYIPKDNIFGAESFTFKVSDGEADSEIVTVSVMVNSVNDLPAAYGQDLLVVEDTARTLTLGAFDMENKAPFYIITVPPQHGTLSGTAPNLIYTPNANAHGRDSFRFKINDGEADSPEATVVLTVFPQNDAPVAQADAANTNEDTEKVIAVLANDTDFDGNGSALAVNAASLTQPAHGTVEVNADGTITYTPAANWHGTDSFTYRAVDQPISGDLAPRLYEFVSAPGILWGSARTAAAQRSFLGRQGYLATITSSSENTIVAGKLLSGSGWLGASDLASEGLWRWVTGPEGLENDGGGSPFWQGLGARLGGAPVGGAYANWLLGFTPNDDAPNQAGEEDYMQMLADAHLGGPATWNDRGPVPLGGGNYSIQGYFVEYGGMPGDAATLSGFGAEVSNEVMVSVTVLPVNDAPVAQGAVATTDEDAAVEITLMASDVEDLPNQLIYTLQVAPGHGSVAIVGNIARYVPAANYNGPDSFTFTVTDTGDGGEPAKTSEPATVMIVVNPVNDMPTADARELVLDEDTTGGVVLTGSDVETAAAALTFTIKTPPAHGEVAFAADGSVIYTPTANYNGSDSFAYTVTDLGDGSSAALESAPATVAITVRPVNDQPVAYGQSVATLEDTTLPIALTASDIDGDALTYSVVSAPTHGALDATEGAAFTYTPDPNFYGADSFTFKVNDGTIDSETVTVSIAVTAVNDAPVPDASATVQKVISPNNTDALVTLDGHRTTDVENDPLTFTWYDGSDFENAIAQEEIAPVTLSVGMHQITLVVSDTPSAGEPESAQTTVTVKVLTACEAVDEVVALIQLAGLPQNTTRSMISQLNAACQSFDQANFGAGVNQLQAFQRHVQGQSGKAVANALAASWIAQAQAIIDAVTGVPSAAPSGPTPAAGLTADDQSVETEEDGAVAITLTGSNAEAQPLTYAEAQPLTYVVTSTPVHGTLSGTVPNLVYRGDANYHGADQFTFTVSNGAGESNTATVEIAVQSMNDAPVADASATATEAFAAVAIVDGQPVEEAQVLLDGSRSSDPDGEPLTYQWFEGASETALLSTASPTAMVGLSPGTYAFSLVVTDSSGAAGPARSEVVVTVHPAPQEVSGPAATAP